MIADGRANILLVDDEPDMLDFIARGLAFEGIDTDLATDGMMALSMLEGSHYDAVVLDLRMPLLPGMSVLKEVRSLRPDIPVLVVSGISSVQTKVSCLQMGAEDYLEKPFELAELVARIRGRLRTAGSG